MWLIVVLCLTNMVRAQQDEFSRLASKDSLNYNSMDCNECIAMGGRQCLQRGDLNFGVCCHPGDRRTNLCKNQYRNTFCADDDVHNRIVREAVCPASETYCPKDDRIVVNYRDHWYQREYVWRQPVPTPKADNWHCKYHISAKRKIVSWSDWSRRGFLFLQIEHYGFDEEVYIIVNRYGSFDDFSIKDPKSKYTRIYRNKFGQKYYIPAEYEVLVVFAPMKNYPNSNKGESPIGKIRLQTKIMPLVDNAHFDDPNVIFLDRPGKDVYEGQLSDGGYNETHEDAEYVAHDVEGERAAALAAQQKEEQQKEDEELNDDAIGEKEDSNEKIYDWDGNEVTDTWWNDEVHLLGGYKLTKGAITKGYGFVSALIIIMSIVAFFIAWRQRRQIDTVIRRTIYQIRNTIKGNQDHQDMGEEDPESARRHQKKAISAQKSKPQKEFLTDLFKHHNDSNLEQPSFNRGNIEMSASNKRGRSKTVKHSKYDNVQGASQRSIESRETIEAEMKDDPLAGGEFDVILGGNIKENEADHLEQYEFGGPENQNNPNRYRRAQTMVKKKKKQSEKEEQEQENADILGIPDQTKLNNEGFHSNPVMNASGAAKKTVYFASQNESITVKDSRTDSVAAQSQGPRGSIYKRGYSQFCKDLYKHNQDENGNPIDKMRGFTKVKAILEDFERENDDMEFNNDPIETSVYDKSMAGTLNNRVSISSKNDFMKIINSCKQDLFDLRELEENKQETNIDLSNSNTLQAEQQMSDPSHFVQVQDIKMADIRVDTISQIDEKDEDFANLQVRKGTILQNMANLTAKKYQNDAAKQKEVMIQIEKAMDEEINTYVHYRNTLKKQQNSGGY